MSFGFHIAKQSKVRTKKFDTYLDAIKGEVKEFGITLIQIFTHGPRSYNKNNIEYKDVKNYCSNNKIEIICHSSYLSNSLWNKINDNKCFNHIKAQMLSCDELNVTQFVLHLPKNTNDVIFDCMKKLGKIKPKNLIISLEMKPLKPHENKTQETPEKINNLCVVLKKLDYKEWNICVDTAHLWGAGIDVAKKEDVRKWLSDLKYPDKIGLFHLNGSFAKKGSFKDKHAIPFSNDDLIWKNVVDENVFDYYKENSDYKFSMKDIKKTGLYEFITFAKLNNIPIVYEINRGNVKYTKFVMDMTKKILNGD